MFLVFLFFCLERPVGLLFVELFHRLPAAAAEVGVVRVELVVERGSPPLGLDLKRAEGSMCARQTYLLTHLRPGSCHDLQRNLREAGERDGHAQDEDEQDQGENQSDVAAKDNGWKKRRASNMAKR